MKIVCCTSAVATCDDDDHGFPGVFRIYLKTYTTINHATQLAHYQREMRRRNQCKKSLYCEEIVKKATGETGRKRQIDGLYFLWNGEINTITTIILQLLVVWGVVGTKESRDYAQHGRTTMVIDRLVFVCGFLRGTKYGEKRLSYVGRCDMRR